ncbi:MAG TPA: hypothetical protein VN605_12705 [Thermoanaerobaculia bacterium]|nr:hypothetical protein [Thermoanaerobaculia bacterium]
MRTLLILFLLIVTQAVQAAGPVMIGEGVISTPADEFGGAITPDGATIYFDRSIPRSYFYVICVSHRRNGRWMKPEVAPFSGRYRDSDPILSPDGHRLYFVSDRPWPGRKEPNYDIWVVDLTGPHPSEPRHLEGAMNSEGNEYFVSEAADGTLYVSSDRPGGVGGSDIYRCPRIDGAYPKAENLGEPVNQKGTATLDAIVSPDQSLLILGAFNRPGGAGDSDLFLSRRGSDGVWSAPEPLKMINTAAREYSPRISMDGRSFVFTSERGFPLEPHGQPLRYDDIVKGATRITNGLGNIYTIPLAELGVETGSPR